MFTKKLAPMFLLQPGYVWDKGCEQAQMEW